MTWDYSDTIESAVALDATQPVYLIYMAWASTSPDFTRICTNATAITWGGYAWRASGARVSGLSMNGGTLELPNGSDDPWLGLIGSDGARGRAITVYEHHTNAADSPQTDAVELFGGVMDDVEISRRGIRIGLIESARNKSFPHTSIDPAVYSWLLTHGDRIYWGPDVVMVE